MAVIISDVCELTRSHEDDFEAMPTQQGYDRWARIYDDEDNPLIGLEEPRVDQLLGDVAGLTIVDIGCGTGRHALRWSASGATVAAIDFSQGMLAKARTKPGAQAVQFIQHDLAQRLPFDDAAFDRVACCLVLDHIHGLDHLFSEMARLCRPTGFVIISVMHPAMMLRGVQARFTDPVTGRQMRPASAANQISDYVTASVRARLRVDHISEHAVDDVLAVKSPRARKYLDWPMLLMMRLKPEM